MPVTAKKLAQLKEKVSNDVYDAIKENEILVDLILNYADLDALDTLNRFDKILASRLNYTINKSDTRRSRYNFDVESILQNRNLFNCELIRNAAGHELLAVAAPTVAATESAMLLVQHKQSIKELRDGSVLQYFEDVKRESTCTIL